MPGSLQRMVRPRRRHTLIKRNLPRLKRRLDLPTGNILENILSGSLLGVLGVGDLTAFVNLDDVREDGVNLLKRTRLAKDAGVINTLKQWMANAAVRDPVRELPQCSAK